MAYRRNVTHPPRPGGMVPGDTGKVERGDRAKSQLGKSALTPTLLMHTPTAPKPPVGILLDPPYLTVDRQSELYGSDADGSSSDVATAAYAWAIANGERFRIAYCCHEGDFPVPDGWTFITAVVRRGQGRGAAGSATGHGDVFAAVRTRRTRPADAAAMTPKRLTG